MTRQRLVVLEVLAENPEQHLTAEEIYERVKVENPDIGLATVYRTCLLYTSSWARPMPISGQEST